MNIKKLAIGFKKAIKKHGLPFHYNIKSYTFGGIGYISVRSITCICSGCLRKLASPWNRSQDKHNQDQYKDENKNCVYWPIMGSYNN